MMHDPDSGKAPSRGTGGLTSATTLPILPPDTDVGAAALAYAANGWPVFPCWPSGESAKAPRTMNGFKDATTDPEQVARWWDNFPDSLIGCAPPLGVIVLDVDRPEALADLEAINGGPLPATLTAHTGRAGGGWHYYYLTDTAGLSQSGVHWPNGKKVQGVDVRLRDKGYLIVPPSPHPDTGTLYEWEHSGPPVPLPEPLVDACRPVAPRTEQPDRVRRSDLSQTPEGLLHTVRTAPKGERNDLLFWAACLMAERDQNGQTTDWEGLTAAATTAGLPQGEINKTINSARRKVQKESPDKTRPRNNPREGAALFFDVAGYLANGLPPSPVPTVCTASDGVGLFYAGLSNTLFGDPESGKTWVACAAIVEVLGAGNRAAFIDLDHNGPAQMIPRFIQLGATVEQLGDPKRFRYVEPDDREHMDLIVKDLAQWGAAIVVLDSVGEIMPLYGGNSNSPDEFTKINRETVTPLTKSGAAVVSVDHVAKNSESKAYGATGTAAKKRAISGTYIRVEAVDAFTPGKGGKAKLTIVKDRPGGLRANRPTGDKEPLAAYFTLNPSGPDPWSLYAPHSAERNPSEVPPLEDQKAIMALEKWPVSQREARKKLSISAERAGVAWRWRKAQEQADTALPGNAPVTGNDSVTRYPHPMSVTSNADQPTT